MMNMKKKSWKDRSAVSPVIATILMVAITVVLAAVLYVMVIGFGGGDRSKMAGTFAGDDKLNSKQEKLTFGEISPVPEGSEIKLGVNVEGYPYGTFAWDSDKKTWAAPSAVGIVDNIEFVDRGGEGKVSQGDYILLTHQGEAGEYNITVTMLNAYSGEMVNNVGYRWAIE